MIKNFKEFVNESYLKGGRMPLYHFTARTYDIIKSDRLKVSIAAEEYKDYKKSLSLTRNYFFYDYMGYDRIELDTDLLIKYGYKPTPVDEVALPERGRTKNINLSKSNIDSFRKAKRGTRHNIKTLPHVKDVILEYEFEERIFKDIEKLGRFIISIVYCKTNYQHKSNLEKNKFSDYLEKYPHIKIYSYSDDIHKLTDETQEFRKENNLKLSELQK